MTEQLLFLYQGLMLIVFFAALVWYVFEYRVRGGKGIGVLTGVAKTALTLGPLVAATLLAGRVVNEVILWLLRTYMIILAFRICFVLVAPSSSKQRQRVGALFRDSPIVGLMVIIGLLILFGPAVVILLSKTLVPVH